MNFGDGQEVHGAGGTWKYAKPGIFEQNGVPWVHGNMQNLAFLSKTAYLLAGNDGWEG